MNKLRLGQAITQGSFTLFPLERVLVGCHRIGDTLTVQGILQPVGVLVQTPEGRFALDINGGRLPLDDLDDLLE